MGNLILWIILIIGVILLWTAILLFLANPIMYILIVGGISLVAHFIKFLVTHQENNQS